MAEIKHKDHKFYVGEADNPTAEMDYIPDGDKIVITHTGVDSSLRGQGVGKQLVQAGVKYAKENNLKINAQCWFAKELIEADSESKDLLVNE